MKEINLNNALLFCQNGHNSINQVRKYTNEPYWVHPVEVMEIVRTVPNHTPAMLAAALFHDLVEDTPIKLEEIEELFGAEVSILVEMLTDVSMPEDGNRRQRKDKDLQHTAKASPEAKTIKLADLISNTKSIVEYDVDFAKVYLREKALLLEVLKEGDKTLYDIAYQLMQDSEMKLMRLTLQ